MRTVTLLVLNPILFVVFLASAYASDADPQPAAIKATLEARFPGIKIDSVSPAPWNGLYEVLTAQELVYTNADASILFNGRIIDTQTKQDLTTKRWNDQNAIEFATLPFELAIRTVKGDGSRKIAVFADPLCPYCRELEGQLQKVTDVTVYTFLLPLERIHPGATEKATQLWCAQDRETAWSNWMLEKIEPEKNNCDAEAMTSIKALSEKLRINSTPTLFFSDGHRAVGSMPTTELEKSLAMNR